MVLGEGRYFEPFRSDDRALSRCPSVSTHPEAGGRGNTLPVCLLYTALPPPEVWVFPHQAILRRQLGSLRFNSILTPSSWR